MGALPLPCEADLGGGVGRSILCRGVEYRRAPRRACPGLKFVACAGVDRAVLRRLLRRGEGVALFVVGISAGALVALKTCDGGRDDDVRNGDAIEETRLVDCAVLREFFGRKHFVVDADGLDRASEIALIVGGGTTPSTANRNRLRADRSRRRAGRHAPGFRLEDRGFAFVVERRCVIVTACVWFDACITDAADGFDPEDKLVVGVVLVSVNSTFVAAAAVEEEGICRGLRRLVGVVDQLYRKCVAEIDIVCKPTNFTAAEHIAVISPFTDDATTGLVPERDDVPRRQIDPRRRIAVVGLRHADVAYAVQLQEQIASCGVAGRLVKKSRPRARREH